MIASPFMTSPLMTYTYMCSLYLRCTAFSYLEGDPELAFFAVYDGHGGTGVANYLKDHLHEFILDQAEYNEGNMQEAVLKAFLQVSTDTYVLDRTGIVIQLSNSVIGMIILKHMDMLLQRANMNIRRRKRR